MKEAQLAMEPRVNLCNDGLMESVIYTKRYDFA